MCFRQYPIPLMRFMEREIGKERFLELLKKAGTEEAMKAGRARAEKWPDRDIVAYTNNPRNPSKYLRHVLSHEVVEDTRGAFEANITECLRAKTFREENAAEFGYLTRCCSESAQVEAYNPDIEFSCTKNLMQGGECCNPRWAWRRTP